MADPNVELLARVATALGDLRERLTFVGGCATGLLITDPAAAPVRATQDVDAIVAVVSLAEYQRVGGALRERGFAQTLEGGEPPYRWTYAPAAASGAGRGALSFRRGQGAQDDPAPLRARRGDRGIKYVRATAATFLSMSVSTESKPRT